MRGRSNMNRAPSSGANHSNVNPELGQVDQRLLQVRLPMANVTRIMRGILPVNAKINEESKESVQKLVSYYINYITKKANKRCKLEKRKTVAAEDILWAMNKMGMTNYTEILDEYLNKYRKKDSVRSFNVRLPECQLGPAPPTAPHPVLPINNESIQGYAYQYFPPNMLFYDPLTAALVASRTFEMGGNDDSPSESSSSTADPYGQFRQ